jgi:thymidylate synthase
MAEYDHVPGLRQQLLREPVVLGQLEIDPSVQKLEDIDGLLEASTDSLLDTFRLSGYAPHPAIGFKVAV